jgi:hypothetical protein
MLAEAQWQRGLGILAFLSSMYVGIALGSFVGHVLAREVFKLSPDYGQRFKAALSAFGFLFLPPLVATWTNVRFDTGIEIAPIWHHFIWACIGGMIFFLSKPSASETKAGGPAHPFTQPPCPLPPSPVNSP